MSNFWYAYSLRQTSQAAYLQPCTLSDKAVLLVVTLWLILAAQWLPKADSCSQTQLAWYTTLHVLYNCGWWVYTICIMHALHVLVIRAQCQDWTGQTVAC